LVKKYLVKSVCLNYILGQKLILLNQILLKNLWSKKNFDPKQNLEKIKVCQNNFLSKKKVSSNNFFGPKGFWYEQIF